MTMLGLHFSGARQNGSLSQMLQDARRTRVAKMIADFIFLGYYCFIGLCLLNRIGPIIELWNILKI